MKITSISRQKNNKNKYSIFIDSKFAFSLEDIDIINYKLKELEDLDEIKYNNILNNVILNKAKNSALKFLSYRKRTKKELITKLDNLNYPSKIINKVVDILQKYKYIDDYDYAYSYIKEKTNIKPQGIIKIKYDLKLKGIDENIINKIIENTNMKEEENIKILIDKKLKNINKDITIKEKNRIYNFLLRRGFSHEDIKKAYTDYFDK